MDLKDKLIVRRQKTRLRIRSKIKKNTELLRLNLFRGNKNLYAQIIDDSKGVTLVAAATNEKDFSSEDKKKNRANVEGAKKLGQIIAQRALEKDIKKVVFDRAGNLYHGKVKAFADAAREGGLLF